MTRIALHTLLLATAFFLAGWFGCPHLLGMMTADAPATVAANTPEEYFFYLLLTSLSFALAGAIISPAAAALCCWNVLPYGRSAAVLLIAGIGGFVLWAVHLARSFAGLAFDAARSMDVAGSGGRSVLLPLSALPLHQTGLAGAAAVAFIATALLVIGRIRRLAA